MLIILNAEYFDTLNPTGFRDAFYAKEESIFWMSPDLEHTQCMTNLDAHLSASGSLHAFLWTWAHQKEPTKSFGANCCLLISTSTPRDTEKTEVRITYTSRWGQRACYLSEVQTGFMGESNSRGLRVNCRGSRVRVGDYGLRLGLGLATIYPRLATVYPRQLIMKPRPETISYFRDL